jgi:hypothetical protein
MTAHAACHDDEIGPLWFSEAEDLDMRLSGRIVVGPSGCGWPRDEPAAGNPAGDAAALPRVEARRLQPGMAEKSDEDS